MQVFNNNGEAVFCGIWSTITAARAFNSKLTNINPDATHWVRYTTGATAALKEGEILTGGTSAATALLVGYVTENGTAGSSDSGILILSRIAGTPTAAGETWTGGKSGGTVATAQAPIEIKAKGQPKSVLITVETAPITFTLCGATPTVSTGTNYGHSVSAGGSVQINGWNNIKSFQAINTTASNSAVLKYTLCF